MIKHYVEFLCAGEVRNHTYQQKVADRKISKVTLPEDCLGFRFLDRLVTVIRGQEIPGLEFNFSGYFYKGEEIPMQYANGRISRRKYEEYENDGYRRVVITPCGQVFPLNCIDEVISE